MVIYLVVKPGIAQAWDVSRCQSADAIPHGKMIAFAKDADLYDRLVPYLGAFECLKARLCSS